MIQIPIRIPGHLVTDPFPMIWRRPVNWNLMTWYKPLSAHHHSRPCIGLEFSLDKPLSGLRKLGEMLNSYMPLYERLPGLWTMSQRGLTSHLESFKKLQWVALHNQKNFHHWPLRNHWILRVQLLALFFNTNFCVKQQGPTL